MYRFRVLLVVSFILSACESDKTGDPDGARSQNADVEEMVVGQD